LYECARKGDTKGINYHLSIDKVDISTGWNALLIQAVDCEQYEVISYLLKNGSGINCQVRHTTALMLASKKGNLKMVKFLLDNGANINEVMDDSCDYFDEPCCALMSAAAAGHLCTVKYLINRGADVTIASSDNGEDDYTALIHAAKNNHFKVVKYLAKISDINILSYNIKNIQIFKYLIKCGAQLPWDYYMEYRVIKLIIKRIKIY